MAGKQNLRCIILSDTHDLEDAFPTSNDKSTCKADIILHCGDMTQIGGLSNYRRALAHVEALKNSANAELALVIAGNHDVSLDPTWWAKNLIEDEDDPEEPLRARDLFAQAQKNGVHFLDEGTHNFTLQDGRLFTIFASPFTPEFGGYAFAYAESEDHFNIGPSRIPEGVDIVMTHGPPSAPAASSNNYLLDLGHEGQHCGCPKLLKAVSRAKPALHCFGHIHEGYGAQALVHGRISAETVDVGAANVGAVDIPEGRFGKVETLEEDAVVKVGAKAARGKQTLLVNAAVQTREGQPNHKPWVVDIELS